MAKLNEKRQFFRREFLQFKTEDEVEKVVAHNFKLLFGDYSILLPKSKILTSGGKGMIPDGIIVDFKENRWFKIEKQKEFSNLLESDLKIRLNNIHGLVQKILEKDPIVSLPIDYSPSDLEEWASLQKVDVQIQHIEKYMNSAGEVLYDFPDLELKQESESLQATNKSNALYELVKSGLLKVGDKVHFDYGPKGKPKTHFEGVVRSDGIEVDGVVSSASISAMRCIQKINPTRTTANGWATWKTVDGKLLEEKWNALLKMNGEQVKRSGKKLHKKKSRKTPAAKPAETDVRMGRN